MYLCSKITTAAFIVCCIIVATATDVVKCETKASDFEAIDATNGVWLKKHNTPATFEEAVIKCKNRCTELAVPVNEILLQKLKAMMEENTSYHIAVNTTTRIYIDDFTSLDDVPLYSMPVDNMTQNLEQRVCLYMKRDSIYFGPCTTKLPFICYSKGLIQNETYCGDVEGYQFAPTTGSCYKVHEEVYLNWTDANALCNAEGGYLAVPNDDEEMRVIHSMFPKTHLPYVTFRSETRYFDPLFIGVRKSLETNQWLSVHGELQEWGWDNNQPDSLSQNCAAMIPSGKLDNNYCKVETYFICEKCPNGIDDEITINLK